MDRKREKESGEQNYKLTKDGKWIVKCWERIGYGSYCIANIRGGACLGSIKKPLDAKYIESFRNDIDSPDVDKGKTYLLSFDPTTKEFTAVIGKFPHLCEEWEGWEERLLPRPQFARNSRRQVCQQTGGA